MNFSISSVYRSMCLLKYRTHFSRHSRAIFSTFSEFMLSYSVSMDDGSVTVDHVAPAAAAAADVGDMGDMAASERDAGVLPEPDFPVDRTMFLISIPLA